MTRRFLSSWTKIVGLYRVKRGSVTDKYCNICVSYDQKSCQNPLHTSHYILWAVVLPCAVPFSKWMLNHPLCIIVLCLMCSSLTMISTKCSNVLLTTICVISNSLCSSIVFIHSICLYIIVYFTLRLSYIFYWIYLHVLFTYFILFLPHCVCSGITFLRDQWRFMILKLKLLLGYVSYSGKQMANSTSMTLTYS